MKKGIIWKSAAAILAAAVLVVVSVFVLVKPQDKVYAAEDTLQYTNLSNTVMPDLNGSTRFFAPNNNTIENGGNDTEQQVPTLANPFFWIVVGIIIFVSVGIVVAIGITKKQSEKHR